MNIGRVTADLHIWQRRGVIIENAGPTEYPGYHYATFLERVARNGTAGLLFIGSLAGESFLATRRARNHDENFAPESEKGAQRALNSRTVSQTEEAKLHSLHSVKRGDLGSWCAWRKRRNEQPTWAHPQPTFRDDGIRAKDAGLLVAPLRSRVRVRRAERAFG